MPEAIGRIDEVVVDCADPARLAAFWAVVFGTAAEEDGADWAWVRDPATGLKVAFQRVPEAKVVKNRAHLDVLVPDLAVATAQCVALGATAVGPVLVEAAGSVQVMLDPEGYEFCLVI